MATSKTYEAKRNFADLDKELLGKGWLPKRANSPGTYLSPVPPPGSADVVINIYGYGMLHRSKPTTLNVLVEVMNRRLTAHERANFDKPTADQRKNERSMSIKAGLDATQALSAGDREFLVSEIKSDYFVNRTIAGMVLAKATQKGLYSQKDLAALFETAMERADNRVEEFGREYAMSLGVKVNGDPGLYLRYQSVVARRQYHDVLDPVEQEFVEECFSESTFSDRQLGFDLLIEKKDLNRATSTWGKDLISKAMTGSTGVEKQFWEFALPVFAARNPVGP